MSDYTNIINRLRTKIGPISLEEILLLQENIELSAGWRPGAVARLVSDELADMGTPVTRWGNTITRATMQQAIDDTAAAGIELSAPGNMALILDGPLYARDGLRLRLPPTARIIRGWDGGTSFGSGIITQENWAANAKISNVHIYGGIWEGSGLLGRVIEFYGDDWLIDGVYVDGWGTVADGSMGILCIGDRFRVRHTTFRNPGADAGSDCIHIAGGSNWLVEDVDGDASDDIVGIFPIKPQISVPAGCANQNILDGVVKNVRGTSAKARLVGCGLHLPELTCDIRRISISNVRGVSSNTIYQGIVVRREDASPGTIQSIELRDLRYSCTASTGGVLAIERVEDVLVDGVDLRGGTMSGLNITGCKRVTVRNAHIDASTGTVAIQALSAASEDLVIEDSYLSCGSGDGIKIGTASTIAITRGAVRRTQIINIADSQRGIAFENAINFTTERTVCARLSGATSTIGFRETSSSSGLRFIDNDLSAVDTPIQNRQPASTRYRNNAGYVTEATVAVTITSGNTASSATAHGLSFTPAAANVVSITPTSVGRATTGVRVSAFDATNITLTSDTAASGGNATFNVRLSLGV